MTLKAGRRITEAKAAVNQCNGLAVSNWNNKNIV
jgi:hypothetical protein